MLETHVQKTAKSIVDAQGDLSASMCGMLCLFLSLGPWSLISPCKFATDFDIRHQNHKNKDIYCEDHLLCDDED
jgi:hypothetical protein